jgi:predicted GNAT superfamily acetyltransferase
VTGVEPGLPAGSDYRIATLETADQRQRAAELYRSVFGYAHPAYGVNPRLLAAITVNGGSVIGAFDPANRLVGFAYGFLGTDGDRIFHYSQAAVVAPELQGKSLGRRLKLAQREIALGWGTTAMRWAYDPMVTRNAHFNLDVLGAVGVSFEPDLYGEPGTDRIVVEWDLTRTPNRRAEPDALPATADWGELISRPDGMLLAVPSDSAGLRAERPEHAALVTTAVRDRLTSLFGDGYQAVSCHSVGATAFYGFRAPTSGHFR